MTTLTAGSGRPAPAIFNGAAFEVFGPPGTGQEFWAGAPNAVVVDGDLYLTFRYRQPEDQGRGMSTVIAKFNRDSGRFEEVLTITKDEWTRDWGVEIDSFERPALVYTKEGRWQLWTCTALPNSTNGKDWSTQVQTADTIEGLKDARPVVLFGGNNDIAYKDPFVLLVDGTYYAWMCCHPLHPLVPLDQEDGMYTELWTSDNGVDWEHVPGADIKPRENTPFSHGTRVAGIVPIPGTDEILLFVDGKASRDENKEERTFLWRGPRTGPYEPVSTEVVGQSTDPEAPGLRYATVAADWLFYELSSKLGHSLVAERHSADALVMSLGIS